jgi:hypothetical protein
MDKIRCRVSVRREDLNDGKTFSLYFINDSTFPLDHVIVRNVGTEWGALSDNHEINLHLQNLAPGAEARIWRDDDDAAELAMYACATVEAMGRRVALTFDITRSYRKGNVEAEAEG